VVEVARQLQSIPISPKEVRLQRIDVRELNVENAAGLKPFPYLPYNLRGLINMLKNMKAGHDIESCG